MKQLSDNEVLADIKESELELARLEVRASNLWKRISIKPEKWKHDQYSKNELAWVVAIIGKRCLYFNEVEGGWGWGEFEKWGYISVFQYQQDYIHHSVFQLLFEIDHANES